DAARICQSSETGGGTLLGTATVSHLAAGASFLHCELAWPNLGHTWPCRCGERSFDEGCRDCSRSPRFRHYSQHHPGPMGSTCVPVGLQERSKGSPNSNVKG